MCDRWIESIQKRLDVSALQREDGLVKWTWCADIFVPILRRYVQIASTHLTPNLAGGSRLRYDHVSQHEHEHEHNNTT
jgi:hypothetical protein